MLKTSEEPSQAQEGVSSEQGTDASAPTQTQEGDDLLEDSEGQPSGANEEPSEVPMEDEGDNLTSQKVVAKQEALTVANAIYLNDPEFKMQKTMAIMTHFSVVLNALEQQTGFHFANRDLVEVCFSDRCIKTELRRTLGQNQMCLRCCKILVPKEKA